MKFELVSVSTQDDNDGEYKLKMLALCGDMEHYATNSLKRTPEIGDVFYMATSWPAMKDGLASTRGDYENYGTRSAGGTFVRVE